MDVMSAMSEEKFQIYLWDSVHVLKRFPKYYPTWACAGEEEKGLARETSCSSQSGAEAEVEEEKDNSTVLQSSKSGLSSINQRSFHFSKLPSHTKSIPFSW